MAFRRNTRGEKLPDVLVPGLDVVFVGTAPSRRSAAVGAYYAHPGNRFWQTLFETGITPRLYEPHEYPQLIHLGIGFTDMAKRASGMDHELLSLITIFPCHRSTVWTSQWAQSN